MFAVKNEFEFIIIKLTQLLKVLHTLVAQDILFYKIYPRKFHRITKFTKVNQNNENVVVQ